MGLRKGFFVLTSTVIANVIAFVACGPIGPNAGSVEVQIASPKNGDSLTIASTCRVRLAQTNELKVNENLKKPDNSTYKITSCESDDRATAREYAQETATREPKETLPEVEYKVSETDLRYSIARTENEVGVNLKVGVTFAGDVPEKEREDAIKLIVNYCKLDQKKLFSRVKLNLDLIDLDHEDNSEKAYDQVLILVTSENAKDFSFPAYSALNWPDQGRLIPNTYRAGNPNCSTKVAEVGPKEAAACTKRWERARYEANAAFCSHFEGLVRQWIGIEAPIAKNACEPKKDANSKPSKPAFEKAIPEMQGKLNLTKEEILTVLQPACSDK